MRRQPRKDAARPHLHRSAVAKARGEGMEAQGVQRAPQPLEGAAAVHGGPQLLPAHTQHHVGVGQLRPLLVHVCQQSAPRPSSPSASRPPRQTAQRCAHTRDANNVSRAAPPPITAEAQPSLPST